ncbi:MAG: aminoglycoside phosphotransferase family protein [Planctomycetes bacterium]|nr:aminoglycoside phosphotransferase family protein [Planctomycetota bacterium]
MTGGNKVEIEEQGSRLLVRKRYGEARHYRQERDALRDWAPRLPFAVPRLLEDLGDERRELLIEGLPGAVPDPTRIADPRLHRSAGAALAALWSLSHEDRDRLAPAEALERRLDSLLREGSFEREIVDLAERARERLLDLEWTRQRVPCHRDYEPRNWVVGPRGFGVIDFEHARPDLAEVDLVRLDLGLWQERSELRAAFLAGAVLEDDEALRDRLAVLGLIETLGTMLWSERRGDAAFVDRGRRQLAVCRRRFRGGEP